jgi:hypothetical protein
MSTRVIRWPVLGVFAAVPLAIAALAISAGQNRAAPLASLERPATSVKATSFMVHKSGYRVVVELSPNRASTTNWLSVKLSRHGRPAAVAGARLAFSMPVMNMWDGTPARSTCAAA